MAERGGLKHPEVPDFTPEEAQAAVGKGTLLIDVREQWEWDAGRMPGARLIPMGQITERLAELPREQDIIFTCRSGNRSGAIKDFLIDEHGYTRVHNLLGGILAWQVAGLPVIR